MLGFLARRLAFLLFAVFGVSILTFCIANLAPGDPARLIAGPQASAENIERVRVELGLDQPAPVQYFRYLQRLGRFDLGVSNVTGRPVLTEILARAPASLELIGGGVLLALVIGVPFGIWASLRRDRWPDRLVRSFAVAGAAVPAFWFGLVLITIFYRNLAWFPASGRFTGAPPPARTGLLTVDSLLAGDLAAFQVAVAHLALPVLSIAILELGFFARLVRNQMLGVLRQDYIRVARAGGLPDATVVRRHALRNGLSPLITVVAASLAAMLYGSVSIETVFGWPGAGQYIVNSIFALDFPVILGFALLTSLVYVLVNVGADLLYGVLDPRARAY